MLKLYYASSSFADQVRLSSVVNSFVFTASCGFINFKAVSVSSSPYCGIMAKRLFEMEAEADSGSSDIEECQESASHDSVSGSSGTAQDTPVLQDADADSVTALSLSEFDADGVAADDGTLCNVEPAGLHAAKPRRLRRKTTDSQELWVPIIKELCPGNGVAACSFSLPLKSCENLMKAYSNRQTN